ncbi:uncharacterized protein K02A2.6-like [Octopus bimaculoides]|uniref:uncharacterized protein K02A2.6-like n=1 Tax=Octopus bimaculoides TaxID=37653 RepID=UPI00071D479A|nr:uncharacterized protein K02A2.6-like [Octopus bimaculoides]|eukprot:XP_014787353.1 PREDICTED: uncharacterized protein K02A2.6-like [Octopus bimaculoides]
MDLDIEKLVKSCRGCTLAAISPLIKFRPWRKTNISWTRLHRTIQRIIVVDSFTKWPEMCKCRNSTSMVTVDFLHKLFARYGIPDSIVSNGGTQFMANEFKNFSKMFSIEHITTLYHLRSNGQAERFVNTFKRMLRKTRNELVDDVALTQFLRVDHVMPNPKYGSQFQKGRCDGRH